jgi:hypothetical protein
VDVLEKSEDMGVEFERRELVVADVYCLYASVGHKSAVDALRLITPLGTNPNLGSRAKTTYERLKKLSAEEVAAIKAGLDAHVVAHPEELQHAVAAFIKLTPAQQDHAGEMANLGCTGNSLNLTVDDSWQKSETFSLLGNMVRDRAARVLQRLLNKTRGAKLIFKGYGKTPECGNLDTQLEFRRELREDAVTKPAFTANWKKKAWGAGASASCPTLSATRCRTWRP